MTNPKEFRAYADKATSTYSPSPRDAALAFFAANPTKRKCALVEGTRDGYFFTVAYGRASTGDWPRSFKDVTKKTATTLPAE